MTASADRGSPADRQPMTSFPSLMQASLRELHAGRTLSRSTMRSVVDGVLEGGLSDDDQAAFVSLLGMLAQRGESADEIAGAAEALRQRMRRVETAAATIADTCGTGGDGSGSFNISTATAFVVAAAGVPVAKHGNRSVSSRTGSADVLEALGVQIELPAAGVRRCLDEAGIGYCHAPNHHPAMARVAAIRKRIGRPTVFNLIGPLCNPAGATVQVIGVGRPAKREPVARAAAMLGMPRALVVSGAATADRCLDEVSIFGPTRVLDVRGGHLEELTWTPEDFGLHTRPVDDESELLVDGPETSAGAIREVLAGGRGPRRDVVLVNAAAVLWAAGQADNLPAARQLAERAIDSGDAAFAVGKLAACSRVIAEETHAASHHRA